MTKTTLVPLLAADGALVGHIPNRASKNPVIGVIRCDCGEPATVHNPKGRRSGHYYTMCSDCGTDQRSGEKRQQVIRSLMVQTVEQLPPGISSDEKKPGEKAVYLPEPEPENNPVPAPTEPKPEPAKPHIKPEINPSQEPPQAAKNAAYTVNQPEPENTEADKPEIKPIGLFALAGAMIGGLIALAA